MLITPRIQASLELLEGNVWVAVIAWPAAEQRVAIGYGDAASEALETAVERWRDQRGRARSSAATLAS